MKTFYVIIALVIGFSFGLLMNPASASAQTISSQDAAILNAQLEAMKQTLIKLQEQLIKKQLMESLNNFQVTLEIIKIKIQNEEINAKTAQSLNAVLAGVKINLLAINDNIQKKSVAVVKKKIPQTAVLPALAPKIQTVNQKETQKNLPEKLTENPMENLPLTASIESTVTVENYNTEKIIFGIIGLIALIMLGYFTWNKKDYLEPLLKMQKDKTIAFLKSSKNKTTTFLKFNQDEIKGKELLPWKIEKEKSAH